VNGTYCKDVEQNQTNQKGQILPKNNSDNFLTELEKYNVQIWETSQLNEIMIEIGKNDNFFYFFKTLNKLSEKQQAKIKEHYCFITKTESEKFNLILPDFNALETTGQFIKTLTNNPYWDDKALIGAFIDKINKNEKQRS
jgi:hypothetical protein